MYQISFDAERLVVNLRLEGFWTLAIMTAFTAELLNVMAMARARYGGFAVLSDSTRFAVQPPEVAALFNQAVAACAEYRTGPMAVVVASVLNKLQARHSLDGKHTQFFLDIDEARQWLEAEWPGAQPKQHGEPSNSSLSSLQTQSLRARHGS